MGSFFRYILKIVGLIPTQYSYVTFKNHLKLYLSTA